MIILTASGWGQHQNNFHEQVKDTITKIDMSNLIKDIQILQWQIPAHFSQKISDLFDFRAEPMIIEDVVNQFIPYYQRCIENYERLMIFSYSTGSFVVENALKPLSLIFPSGPKIMHVMFAPAISGSNLASIASNTLPIVLGVGTAYGVSKTQGNAQIALGLFGTLLTLGSIFFKDKMIDKLSESTQIDPNLVSCKRFIFQSGQDEVVKIIPQDIPFAVYFVGEYFHGEVGDLSETGRNQKYSVRDHNFEKTMTKEEILLKIISK